MNLLVFMLSTLGVSWQNSIFEFSAIQGYAVIIQGEFYRLFTSMFVHNDIIHISMNMLSLYMVGRIVERLFSSWAYLALYFISGFFGSFAYMSMTLYDGAVGASGAIFGIFGALAGFVLVHRRTMQQQFMQFMRDFGIILVINFFIGVIFPNIAMSAHIGGLVAGVIGGFIIAKNVNNLWIYIVISTLILVGVYIYLPSLYLSFN
ncbi:FIG056164: rhomboid family serine protease [hydrothermal vent metagenome]|uniref:FIG056164: rhomboid family serine protease n=1 Tax=hydrothermal vent metagenome TaxID=652676 RepID=A0A1W1BHK7_9ZZZZ